MSDVSITRSGLVNTFSMEWPRYPTLTKLGKTSLAKTAGKPLPWLSANYINRVSSMVGVPPDVPLNSIQSSFTGPGNYSPPADSSSPDSTDSSSSDSSPWYAGILPDPSATVDLGVVVLSESELLLLAAAVVGTVLVFSIL